MVKCKVNRREQELGFRQYNSIIGSSLRISGEGKSKLEQRKESKSID